MNTILQIIKTDPELLDYIKPSFDNFMDAMVFTARK